MPHRLLRTTAIGLALGFFPLPPIDIFVYATAHAQGYAPTTPHLLPDGSTLPDWIKASCCGPQDAHHLRAEQVHRRDDGKYQVDGYSRPIPNNQALPSQDGDYWIFYRDNPAGPSCTPEGGCHGTHPASQSGVYCFFVPMEF